MMDAQLLGEDVTIDLNVWNAPEELLAMVQGGEHDMYAFPLTVISTLYNKGLDVRLMNVNTWGVTYFMTTDPDFTTWSDLAGKTVYIPLQSSPPDALTQYFLNEAGLTVDEDVEVVYHRTINDMSALRSEYDEAVEEGVKFNWESSLAEILDYNGVLSGVVIEHNGERRIEKADKVLMAIGSVPASRIVSTTKGIEVDERGYVLTRENPYGMTTRKGVFAGGDVVNRPSTVVLAMRDAKRVAEGMAKYVDAIKLLQAVDSATAADAKQEEEKA